MLCQQNAKELNIDRRSESLEKPLISTTSPLPIHGRSLLETSVYIIQINHPSPTYRCRVAPNDTIYSKLLSKNVDDSDDIPPQAVTEESHNLVVRTLDLHPFKVRNILSANIVNYKRFVKVYFNSASVAYHNLITSYTEQCIWCTVHSQR